MRERILLACDLYQKVGYKTDLEKHTEIFFMPNFKLCLNLSASPQHSRKDQQISTQRSGH